MEIKNKHLINKVMIVLVGLSIIFFTIMLFIKTNKEEEPVTLEIEFNEKFSINAEIADSEYLRSRGLMFREELDEKKGMLFVYDTEVKNGFWMKNTKIPLDIVFLSNDFEIVYILDNVQPCITANCESYMPDKFYKYAIEINGNLCEKYDIKLGDRVKFDR